MKLTKEEKEILERYATGLISKEEAQISLKLKKVAFNKRINLLGYNRQNFDITKKGYISKKDKIFWENIHHKYLEGASLDILSKELGLHQNTIKERFSQFELPLKDITQRYIEIHKKQKETMNIRYGVDYPLQSKEILANMQAKVTTQYGVANVSQLVEIKEKIRASHLAASKEDLDNRLEKRINTTKKNYGKDFVGQLDLFKDKAKKTYTKKTGFSHPQKNPEIRRKTEETCLIEFGTKYSLASPKVIAKRIETVINRKIERLLPQLAMFDYQLLDTFTGVYEETLTGKKQKRYRIKHLKCGLEFEDDIQLIPRCQKCFPLIGTMTSQIQIFYENYIKNILGIDIISNTKDIIQNTVTNKWLELDIWIPEKNIGFEINGLYTHSLGHSRKNKKSWKTVTYKEYHKIKTESALKRNIKIYHIWENTNPEIIKSKIALLTGNTKYSLGARNLIFKKITNKEAFNFYEDTHIHGGTISLISFGLFLKEELISVLSFRKYSVDTLEISRFSTRLDTNVAGGFSKLMKNSLKYLKTHLPNITNIITYVDRDWSPTWENTVYSKFGFKFEGDTGPSLFYTNFRKLFSRQKYQKYKLKKLFPDVYKDSLTEQQILSLKNIYPIYNSGNWKFNLKVKN